jgi:3-oxoacyl-(acyl-carrier-protein) synthase
MRDVVITGVAAMSSAGSTPDELAAALDAGALLDGDITAFECAAGEPTRACELSEFDLSSYAPSIKSYIDRTSALALAACRVALEGAGLLEEEGRPAGELGLVYGTQWGCVDSMELFYAKLKGGNPRFAPPLPFSHSYANSPASVMAIELKLRGYHLVLSSGRTSGALALQAGLDAIALGRADRIVCVASDSLSRPTFSFYHEGGSLLPDDVRPPADDETRFVLAESGCAIVLEEAAAAAERGATVRARVLSAGTYADADLARAVEDATRAAMVLGGVLPGGIVGATGAAPSRGAEASEVRGLAAAVEVDEERASQMYTGLGRVLGESLSVGGLLAAGAACAEGATRPRLILAADDGAARPSAVALLIASP